MTEGPGRGAEAVLASRLVRLKPGSWCPCGACVRASEREDPLCGFIINYLQVSRADVPAGRYRNRVSEFLD